MIDRRHNKMNSLITTALLMHNDPLSQAYIYAIEHMDMKDIIWKLKRAINNPGRRHTIVLFKYKHTNTKYNHKERFHRTKLQCGKYLDETFQHGLFTMLRQMFDMSLQNVDVYSRYAQGCTVIGSALITTHMHDREVVLSIGGGGGM